MPEPGRPTQYTSEIADEILMRIAGGESLRTVCKSDHMPAASTVCLWVVDDREGFSERYARARQAQAHSLVDELFDIADDGANDLMTITKGSLEYEIENKEVTRRSALRCSVRQWYVGKVLPKVYGEKVAHEHKGTLTLESMVTSAAAEAEER